MGVKSGRLKCAEDGRTDVWDLVGHWHLFVALLFCSPEMLLLYLFRNIHFYPRTRSTFALCVFSVCRVNLTKQITKCTISCVCIANNKISGSQGSVQQTNTQSVVSCCSHRRLEIRCVAGQQQTANLSCMKTDSEILVNAAQVVCLFIYIPSSFLSYVHRCASNSCFNLRFFFAQQTNNNQHSLIRYLLLAIQLSKKANERASERACPHTHLILPNILILWLYIYFNYDKSHFPQYE